MKYTFFITYVISLVVAKAFGSKTHGYGKSGDMVCPSGQVFAITYFNETASRLEMRCIVPMICGVAGELIGKSKNCPRDGEFMMRANEHGLKYGNVIETCNRYKVPPEEDYEQICVTLLVNDNQEPYQGRTRLRRSMWLKNAKFEDTVDKDIFIKHNHASNGRRQKRAYDLSQTDIYVSNVSQNVDMTWFVKDISRKTDHYKVVGCQVICRNSNEQDDADKIENSDFYNIYRSNGGNGNSGTGSEGAAFSCFSAEDTAETMQGSVRMDQLKVGDKVVTFSGKLGVYALDEIQYFLHREPNKEARFVVIETKSGMNISLTSDHLLPVVDCVSVDFASDPDLARRMNKKFTRPAKLAKPGQCVIIKNNQQALVLEEITKVGTTSRKGIYAPVTRQQNLLVNGVHASCFSKFEDYTVVHGLFMVYQALLDFIEATFGSFHHSTINSQTSDDTLQLPHAVLVLFEAAKKL